MGQMLANAAVQASSDELAIWLLQTLGVLVICAAVALLPIWLAARRRRADRESLFALVFFWIVITTAMVSYYLKQQADWVTDRNEQIENDARDLADQPAEPNVPSIAWALIGTGYTALIAWAMTGPVVQDTPD